MYKGFSDLLTGGSSLGIPGLTEFDFSTFSIGDDKAALLDLIENGPVCPVCGERHDAPDEDDRVQNTTDDFAGDTTTTGVLASDTSLTGTIEVTGDDDWFAITLPAGVYGVRFTLTGGDNAGELFDPLLSLYDATGTLLGSWFENNNPDSGLRPTDAQATFGTSPVSEDLFLGVTSNDGGTGSYTLSYELLADDHHNWLTTTSTIAVGGSVTAVGDYRDDLDMFAFTVAAGDTVFYENATFTAYVLIFDSTGLSISGGFSNEVTFETGGTYYLGAIGFNEGVEYTVSLTAVEATPDDYADDITTTGVLTLGGSVSGMTEVAGDVDWFAVTVSAGDIVSFSNNQFQYMDVYDATGTYYGPAEEFMPVQFTEGGTYFVAYSSFQTGSYTISASLPIVDDYAGDITTTGVLALGGSVTGNIDFEGDEDWFAVTVSAGDIVSFTNDLFFPMSVYDSAGNFFASADELSPVTFTEGGTYFVSYTEIVTGPYTITASLPLVDDFAGDASTTGTITVGGTATGNVDFAGDADWFAFTITEATAVSFAANNDVSVYVVDANGISYGSGYGFQGGTASLAAPGTYYVSVVGDFLTETSAYSVSLSEIVDDFAGDTTTTGVLALGGSVTGSLDFAFDQDWFAFSVAAGDVISFTNSFGSFMSVYDAAGNFVSGASANQAISFAEGGTYYVTLDTSFAGGTYTLSASNPIVDDFAGDATTTGVITAGGTATGAIDFQNDSDWFAISVNAGDIISFSADVLAQLDVFDAAGNYFASASFGGVYFAEAGTYFVQIADFFPQSYTLSASAATQDDFAGDVTTTGVLALDSVVTGTLDFQGDADWFAITVTTDTLISIDLFEYVSLYDSNGNFLSDGYQSLTVTAPGDYFVSVTGTSTGSYSLSATSFVDDFAGDASTTGVLTLDGTATGNFESPNDSDWFAIEVVSGEAYTITLTATELELGGDLTDPYLRIVDATGSEIAYAYSDFAGNIELTFTATVTGTLYADATNIFGGTGAYELGFTQFVAPEDDYAGDITTTGVVVADGTATGTLEVGGDQDWFALEVVAGETYIIDLTGNPESANFLGDPYLYLYDDQGNLIAANDDTNGLNPQIEFTATTSGTVFVGAAGFGSNTGDYLLSVDLDVPPPPLDPTGAVSVAIGDRAAGTLEAEGEVDIFAIEVVAGQSYTFFLIRDTEDALQNPSLALYDANGIFVTENDDIATFEWNSRIDFTATETGTMYLTATSSDGENSTLPNYLTPDHTGGYTLYVENSDERPDFTAEEVAGFLIDSFSPFASAWTGNVITYDVSALPGPAQTLAILAMQAWADLTPLQFVEAQPGEMANIVFGDSDSGAYATSLGPDGSNQVFINVAADWSGGLATNPDGSLNEDPTANLDDYLYQTYLHEVGHALGLGHSGSYNAGSGLPITYEDSRLYNQDFWTMTLMSYFPQSEAGTGDFRFVLTPQEADIVAIQSLYGANTTTRSGNTVYGFNSTEAGTVYDFTVFEAYSGLPPAITIYDTGGRDTIDLSGYSGDQVVSLQAGVRSTIGGTAANPGALAGILNIMTGTVVEDLIGGSGNDDLTGNSAKNLIEGGVGNDLINGMLGDDILFGGDGEDTIFGSAGHDHIDGGSGADDLRGGSGHDVIDGGFGSDFISGGDGNDLLRGGMGSDDIRAGAGDDSVAGGIGSDLIYGNAGNDNLSGENGNDTIYGQSGNDQISGGLGIDMLYGGSGDDIMHGQEGTDTMDGGSGNDRMYGGDDADIMLGGTGNDRMFGDAGNDRIDGGAGRNQLFGGDGADTFGNLSGGTDVINDFTQGEDVLMLDLLDFAELMTVAVQTSRGVRIDDANGSSYILIGLDLADLTADDFLFDPGVA